MNKYIDETCQVVCIDNNKIVTADVLDIKEGKMLSVSINKSVKLMMPWNGYIYEGRMSGLTFTSAGPIIKNVKTTR